MNFTRSLYREITSLSHGAPCLWIYGIKLCLRVEYSRIPNNITLYLPY